MRLGEIGLVGFPSGINMIYYSKQTDRIYDDGIHDNIPIDAIEISDREKNEHMGNLTSEGKVRVKGVYPFEFEDIPELTPEQLANIAQSEMVNELNWCDLQIKLHQSSDSRAVTTLENIFAYARSCRDYVRNLDGVLTIVCDKPSRPE
ncbi:hypothetical protein NVP1273O_58 [Vibrio phage 1.273.O._10N.286.54.C7]|nr:hypothetical protein NVP1273O_58 [Vibrio phage 1.273.O._10N.286.54.C7]